MKMLRDLIFLIGVVCIAAALSAAAGWFSDKNFAT